MSPAQNISDFIKVTTKQLHDAGIATARLDCLILLEDELGKDRAWLLANPDFQISTESKDHLATKVSKRITHIPIAYIRGKAEFYGREFDVNTHTLVPRPETENMIDLLKTLPIFPHSRFLDVGTGSGCIAISAALEIPLLDVSACDIDEQCLNITRRNAHKLDARIEIIHSNLLESTDTYDILGVNLPYVPNEFRINTAATHEPRRAIYGGDDGLDLYRKLFRQITALPRKPQHILTESLPFQHGELKLLAKAVGFTLVKSDDFIQLFDRD